jgi:hypothetical protein
VRTSAPPPGVAMSTTTDVEDVENDLLEIRLRRANDVIDQQRRGINRVEKQIDRLLLAGLLLLSVYSLFVPSYTILINRSELRVALISAIVALIVPLIFIIYLYVQNKTPLFINSLISRKFSGIQADDRDTFHPTARELHNMADKYKGKEQYQITEKAYEVESNAEELYKKQEYLKKLYFTLVHGIVISPITFLYLILLTVPII